MSQTAEYYDARKPKPVNANSNHRLLDVDTGIDWRDKDGKNFISPIRDQGTCGASYAFSAIATIENAQWKKVLGRGIDENWDDTQDPMEFSV